jgi:hypothetical protein
MENVAGSETEGHDESLCVGMILQHLAVESLARFAVGWIAPGFVRQFATGGADDGTRVVTDVDVEAEISAVHLSGLPLG